MRFKLKTFTAFVGVSLVLLPVTSSALAGWRPVPRLALVRDDGANPDNLYYYFAATPAPSPPSTVK
jgi:hypothetical protein